MPSCLSSASACRLATRSSGDSRPCSLNTHCHRVWLPFSNVYIPHYKYLAQQIAELDREIAQQLADDDLGRRLLTIPEVGPITASVLTAEMGMANNTPAAVISLPR